LIDSNPIKSSKHQFNRREIPWRNQFFNNKLFEMARLVANYLDRNRDALANEF
jgi:hypothetical protein